MSGISGGVDERDIDNLLAAAQTAASRQADGEPVDDPRLVVEPEVDVDWLESSEDAFEGEAEEAQPEDEQMSADPDARGGASASRRWRPRNALMCNTSESAWWR